LKFPLPRRSQALDYYRSRRYIKDGFNTNNNNNNSYCYKRLFSIYEVALNKERRMVIIRIIMPKFGFKASSIDSW
jgi:hypothetical protein